MLGIFFEMTTALVFLQLAWVNEDKIAVSAGVVAIRIRSSWMRLDVAI